ncbi:MAG: capsule assembly Wzi family protein [Candidatus Jettenia sp. CY-1]|nr:MAG: capsule assembly Wzi family protein [Candidatus Jettenia sp. CY-1]
MFNNQTTMFLWQRWKVCYLVILPYLLFAVYSVVLIPPLQAGDRTNVPLKNWGGFSLFRSWVYDALEKIVLAGLADQALLNTKPLSRMEAARIVAQAIHKLEQDYGDYNDRNYLEDLLYKLIEEFGSELAEMGVKTPLNYEAQPKFLNLKPVDNIQFGNALANNSQKPVNNFGRSFSEGINTDFTFDGRNQLGDFLSLYYQPEFFLNKDGSQGRLQIGYAKLTLWNTELEVGRDSLWWGPGYHGSMLFSNNAPPLDQIRLGSAEPFRLPWIFRHIGPIKATTFVGKLDGNQIPSHPLVGGYRISLAPSRFVEIGHGRAYQFAGDGRGYTIKDFPGTIFQTTTSEDVDDPDSNRNVNNLLSLDITVRIPNVDRYIFIARDVSLYGEMGWDDTRKGWIYPKQPGGIVGTYLTGFLGDPKLDFRLEYAKSTSIMFTHNNIYENGFIYRDSVLSHFIGTDGSELYARLSRWINEDILLGFQASRAEIGTTQHDLVGKLPHEKRYSFGLDASYQVSDRSSIFLQYDFSRITNHDFVSGERQNDHLFRFEFTYSL